MTDTQIEAPAWEKGHRARLTLQADVVDALAERQGEFGVEFADYAAFCVQLPWRSQFEDGEATEEEVDAAYREAVLVKLRDVAHLFNAVRRDLSRIRDYEVRIDKITTDYSYGLRLFVKNPAHYLATVIVEATVPNQGICKTVETDEEVVIPAQPERVERVTKRVCPTIFGSNDG